MGVDVAARLTPVIFFQNLFFLQVSVADTFGSDSALWSLAYEFWFYILFPLGIFAFARRTQLGKRIVSATFLLAIAWFGRVYFILFPIWLLGALLAVLPTLRLRAGARLLAALVYVPIFFLGLS
jgi:peptidoglycan/LPS O-acetylase OafA/YrhL